MQFVGFLQRFYPVLSRSTKQINCSR